MLLVVARGGNAHRHTDEWPGDLGSFARFQINDQDILLLKATCEVHRELHFKWFDFAVSLMGFSWRNAPWMQCGAPHVRMGGNDITLRDVIFSTFEIIVKYHNRIKRHS